MTEAERIGKKIQDDQSERESAIREDERRKVIERVRDVLQEEFHFDGYNHRVMKRILDQIEKEGTP